MEHQLFLPCSYFPAHDLADQAFPTMSSRSMCRPDHTPESRREFIVVSTRHPSIVPSQLTIPPFVILFLRSNTTSTCRPHPLRRPRVVPKATGRGSPSHGSHCDVDYMPPAVSYIQYGLCMYCNGFMGPNRALPRHLQSSDQVPLRTIPRKHSSRIRTWRGFGMYSDKIDIQRIMGTRIG